MKCIVHGVAKSWTRLSDKVKVFVSALPEPSEQGVWDPWLGSWGGKHGPGSPGPCLFSWQGSTFLVSPLLVFLLVSPNSPQALRFL